MGALWECPQIIEVDGRHVMVSSVWDDDVLHYAGYAVGRYADGAFTAESWGRLTYGPSYYAPSFFRDADGRPCLTFWMRGIADVEAGWASAHSVPHVLTLDGDRLVATPHPDVDAVRGRVADDGRLAGLAGDLVWSPAARRRTADLVGRRAGRLTPGGRRRARRSSRRRRMVDAGGCGDPGPARRAGAGRLLAGRRVRSGDRARGRPPRRDE